MSRIVSFEPDDLAGLARRSAAAAAMLREAPDLGRRLAGEAWTLDDGCGRVLACAGLLSFRPKVAETWAFFADGSRAGRPLVRFARFLDGRMAGLLAAGAWHRIEARVDAGFAAGLVWAKACGFGRPEALLHCEGAFGQDRLLYARWRVRPARPAGLAGRQIDEAA